MTTSKEEMTNSMEAKLDNPVWYSLHESHHQHSIDDGNISFYHPDYCPFGGFIENSGIENAIDQYAELVSKFYVVGLRPKFNRKVSLINELVCEQMLLDDRIDIHLTEEIIPLSNEFEKDLFDLVNLVQPGYFMKRTSDLGSYYGIFKEGKLVAVTGERMKMHAYTEVSAVVTHPHHTGKGYAKQLIALTTKKIFEQNKQPYLHVSEANEGAIALYKKLGFTSRRTISFWTFIREEAASNQLEFQ